MQRAFSIQGIKKLMISFTENFEKGILFSLLSILSLNDNVIIGSALELSFKSCRLDKIHDVVDIANAIESISEFWP